MLLEQEMTPVETRGLSAVATATIKATPKIFNFFADQTYSNKPLAICRELVSNAIDAHTAAGIPEVAVEVWLPTEFDPMFRVKDQGIGMSHEFMMTGFLAYTDGSTKDNSNDQIGGFGIGSKSPFAYTDQYTLRVVHNGTLSIYTMFKNEEGIPSLGVLSQSPTSEANGVEVNFPVEMEDFERFHTAAQQGLAYFNPLPKVYGGTVEAPQYTSAGNGWGMRKEYGALNVVMGGVCYPVATHSIDYDVRSEKEITDLFNFGLDITLPIGTCGVSLSRESLSYDKKTSESIGSALRSLVDEVTASFATMFDGYETEWEAMEALVGEIGSGHSGRGQFLAKKALYKGEELPVDYRINCGTWVIETPTYRRGKHNEKLTMKWEYSEKSFVKPGTYEQIIIDDLPQTSASKTGVRLKHYAKEQLIRSRNSVVIRPRFEVTIEDLVKTLGNIPRDRYVLTSELEVPAPESRARVGNRPRVRMFTYTGYEQSGYQSNRNNINPGTNGRTGVYEIDYYDQPDEGVLVVMENFEMPRDLRDKVRTELISWGQLYFVNRGDAAKLKGHGWLSYDEVFQEALADVLAQAPDLPQMLALSYNQELRDVFNLIRSLGVVELTAAQQSRPFGKIYNLVQKYLVPLTAEQTNVAAFVTATLPAKVDPIKLVESFETKQPRAARLADLLRYFVVEQADRDFFLELI